MGDADSEISDWEWEVLSAASACGGDERDDVVVVSGGGGDVLPDHFTLDLASLGTGFSGEGSWSEPDVACFNEYRREGLELLDEFDYISQEDSDLVAGLPTLQLQEGGPDENLESSVREAAAACGANCGAEGRKLDAIGLEPENNAARSGGESESPPQLQPARDDVGEPSESDSSKATDAPPESEVSQNSSMRLEDVGVDSGTETSCVEEFVTADGVHVGQAEQSQGSDDCSGSGCAEMGGEAKGDALPLVRAAPGAGEEGKQVVVWWRLPFKLLHYCAWNVKPAWSFSIAAALLGLVVLGRKMYRMKHKGRGMPQIKIAFDDKRASQNANHARFNEAFLIARRVPMLRTSSGAMLPWSMVQER